MSEKSAAPLNFHGRSVQNQILLGLPKPERLAILAKLEFVSLPTHSVLVEAGGTIKWVYFVNEGLASVLSVVTDGKSIEVGLCGHEGFVGLPLIAGFKTSPTRVIMQVGGSAFRMPSKDFREALRQSPILATALQRFGMEMALQSARVAACNSVHEINARLARWLLMSHDRLGGDVVPLTQEFLSHMLGSRRASVTVAAGALQRKGLISYTRGSVVVKNRAGLESATCECYAGLTDEIEKWKSEVR